MEQENIGPFRRTSARTRKMAGKMAAALASTDNRTQAAIARLEALENDNAGAEAVDLNDDGDASLDDDEDIVYTKKQSKNSKRKTRQAKALESAKKAPRTFLEVLHDFLTTAIMDVPTLFDSVHALTKWLSLQRKQNTLA